MTTVRMTWQQKAIKCNRIWCTACPHEGYWYAFYRDPVTHKKKAVYKGRGVVPPEPDDRGVRASVEMVPRRKRRPAPPPPPPPPPPPLDPRVLDAQDAAVLRVPVAATYAELKSAYRKAIALAHPDRAGDAGTETARGLNVAYDRMLSRRGWARV